MKPRSTASDWPVCCGRMVSTPTSSTWQTSLSHVNIGYPYAYRVAAGAARAGITGGKSASDEGRYAAKRRISTLGPLTTGVESPLRGDGDLRLRKAIKHAIPAPKLSERGEGRGIVLKWIAKPSRRHRRQRDRSAALADLSRTKDVIAVCSAALATDPTLRAAGEELHHALSHALGYEGPQVQAWPTASDRRRSVHAGDWITGLRAQSRWRRAWDLQAMRGSAKKRIW